MEEKLMIMKADLEAVSNVLKNYLNTEQRQEITKPLITEMRRRLDAEVTEGVKELLEVSE